MKIFVSCVLSLILATAYYFIDHEESQLETSALNSSEKKVSRKQNSFVIKKITKNTQVPTLKQSPHIDVGQIELEKMLDTFEDSMNNLIDRNLTAQAARLLLMHMVTVNLDSPNDLKHLEKTVTEYIETAPELLDNLDLSQLIFYVFLQSPSLSQATLQQIKTRHPDAYKARSGCYNYTVLSTPLMSVTLEKGEKFDLTKIEDSLLECLENSDLKSDPMQNAIGFVYLLIQQNGMEQAKEYYSKLKGDYPYLLDTDILFSRFNK